MCCCFQRLQRSLYCCRVALRPHTRQPLQLAGQHSRVVYLAHRHRLHICKGGWHIATAEEPHPQLGTWSAEEGWLQAPQTQEPSSDTFHTAVKSCSISCVYITFILRVRCGSKLMRGCAVAKCAWPGITQQQLLQHVVSRCLWLTSSAAGKLVDAYDHLRPAVDVGLLPCCTLLYFALGQAWCNSSISSAMASAGGVSNHPNNIAGLSPTADSLLASAGIVSSASKSESYAVRQPASQQLCQQASTCNNGFCHAAHVFHLPQQLLSRCLQ